MSAHTLTTAKPVTLSSLQAMPAQGEKIACLTAYDASFAAMVDRSGGEVILVGDSLGMVVQGKDTTVPVTVDEMVYHTACVSRVVKTAFVMADLPFLSYTTRRDALEASKRLMQEGGAKMVKLEGGALQAEIVKFLTDRGVPVCAHVGLTPQSVHKLGGFKVQGREAAARAQMLADVDALQAAGADMLLVECVPASLGAEVKQRAHVPVIGIGAGAAVDGQILVLTDVLGLAIDEQGKKPRFVRDFMAGAGSIAEALSRYVQAVNSGEYPAAEHTFGG